MMRDIFLVILLITAGLSACNGYDACDEDNSKRIAIARSLRYL